VVASHSHGEEVIRMTYERPAVIATYKVEELMKDAAVCTVYCAKEILQ
jgi:hypothetical protein